jgi:hypothetical protein
VDDPHEWNDNEIASCCRCGVEVVHRPHVPRPCEFVCIPCWLVEVQPDDEIGITPETAHEFAQWLASTLRGRHQ